MSAADPVPLICLPFAGAGASFYAPWKKLGIPHLEIHPLQLPGRERLIDDPPWTDLHEAAEGLLPAALKSAADRPVAVFGHCLGSVLAFELAHRLADHGIPVLHLFASASRSPWNGRVLAGEGLDDDQFLDLVEQLTGYRHPAFDIPEMRELLLPTLKADFAMYESYQPTSARRLTAPVTALWADQDQLVSRTEAAGWQEATDGAFQLIGMTGGHMYLSNTARPLLERIADTVAGVPAQEH